ncbi:MAG: hypothetical protein KAX47_05940, partial [Zoogloea sp.]|nr:hypothetical protein [Zoogloea sp.]
MLLLTGYAERLSAREGETLRFHVANATGEPVRAKVVRVVCADANPQIGGVVTEPVPLAVSTLAEPGPQGVPSGSYAALGISGQTLSVGDCTVTLRLHPTLKLSRRQVVLSWLDGRGVGLELELTPALTLKGRIGTGSGEATIESRGPVPLNAWSTVTLTVDTAAGMLGLSVTALAAHATADAVSTTLPASAQPAGGSRRLSLASGSDQAPVDTFNGRLENPKLFSRALSSGELARVWAGESVEGLLAAWDFALEMHTGRIIDTGPGGHHGELVNTPTRAVTGSTWTGREHCFRHAPDQYGAIHFHDDDLDDCRWPATHAVTIPEGFKSDAYALILTAGGLEENIPFFVVPPKGRARARIAVLVSTYTYTIYGNHARPEWMLDAQWREAHIAQTKAWGAY